MTWFNHLTFFDVSTSDPMVAQAPLRWARRTCRTTPTTAMARSPSPRYSTRFAPRYRRRKDGRAAARGRHHDARQHARLPTVGMRTRHLGRSRSEWPSRGPDLAPSPAIARLAVRPRPEDLAVTYRGQDVLYEALIGEQPFAGTATVHLDVSFRGTVRHDLSELGHTGIQISPIGLGCMQFSGVGQVATSVTPIEQPRVDEIVKAALDGGITWFDTAEAYGHGRSERALSSGLTSCGSSPAMSPSLRNGRRSDAPPKALPAPSTTGCAR